MAFNPYNYQRYQNIGDKSTISAPDRTLMPGSGMSFDQLDSYRRVMGPYEQAMRDWYETEQGDRYRDARIAAQMRAVGEATKGLQDCGGGFND